VLLYAHRGSSRTKPENSLAAFEQAIVDGADGVELDLRATADGVPVILHDRELDRTTSGTGPVDGVTLAELRGVDAGDGRPVPTLAEVLDLLAGRLALDLEIKQAGIEREVVAVLAGYPDAEWFVSSFDWDVLRAFRAAAPGAAMLPLAMVADDGLFAVARELGAKGVALFAGGIDAGVARRCEEEELELVAWTVNEVEEARRLREVGVAAVCTDVPALIRAGL